MLDSDVKVCETPPPPSHDELTNKGSARRQMRGWELSGGLYAEHRNYWEVGPLENFTYKCDLRGLNTVSQRIIHHHFKRTGKPHVTCANITGILRPGPVPWIHSSVLYVTCS
jgi:hypothetical protein